MQCRRPHGVGGPAARPPAVVAVATSLLLVGCGGSRATLETSGIEAAIAQSMLRQRGVHARVACPDRVARKRGTTFSCTAALEVGRYPISVVETDDAGHVRYSSNVPLVKLDTPRVARSIEASIEHQRGLRASVRCPAEVLQQAGLRFDCHAVANGRSNLFEVTQTDGRGHVTYVGR
jgi:hypothetical protein